MATVESNKISLKEFSAHLVSWFRYLRSKLWLISMVVLIGAVIGFTLGYFSKPTYTGNLTFVLSPDNKAGALSSLAGQFGFDFGGSTDDAFSGDNIMELLKSQRMVKGALFRMVPGNGGCLVSRIIKQEGFDKKWASKEHLKNALPFPCDVSRLTPLQDSLANELHNFILNNYLTIDKVDKKLSYYVVSTACDDPVVANYLTRFLVEESSKFYIDTKTKTAKANLDMLQHEADSLRRSLGGSITNTAEEADRIFNLNPAFQVQRAQAQQGQIRSTVLSTAYGEVVKNLELAKITLQKETPLYQVIDTPSELPKGKRLGRLKGLVMGILISGFLITFWLTAKKLWKQAIQ